MKFCIKHWDQLREAVERKGMGHLIAKSGEEAMNNVEAQLTGEDDITNFDPLLAAHNLIVYNAIEVLGLYVMRLDKNGEHICPLCELDRELPEGANNSTFWIEESTDAVLDYCKNNRLLR